MRMGDKDDVDVHVVDKVRNGVGVPVEQTETIHEERVGENADAIDLDEGCRVSEVANMREHRPSLMLE